MTRLASKSARRPTMRTLALILLLFTSGVTAHAQGTVLFNNATGTGLNAPIFNFDCTAKVSTGYTAELLAGPTLNDMRSVATTTFITSAPGYFWGGVVTVSNVAPGAAAWCVVQV